MLNSLCSHFCSVVNQFDKDHLHKLSYYQIKCVHWEKVGSQKYRKMKENSLKKCGRTESWTTNINAKVLLHIFAFLSQSPLMVLWILQAPFQSQWRVSPFPQLSKSNIQNPFLPLTTNSNISCQQLLLAVFLPSAFTLVKPTWSKLLQSPTD